MRDLMKCDDLLKIGMRGYRDFTDVNWHGKFISIRYMLDMQEVLKLLNNIEDRCKDGDGEISTELLDFSIKIGIVNAYAYVELPTNIDELYRVIYHSDIYDTVVNTANKKQIDSIIHFFDPWR